MQTVRQFAEEKLLVLFDSAAGNTRDAGRYTFLTADPIDTCRIDSCEYGDRPFVKLRKWTERFSQNFKDPLPPFFGGIAGMMSYELGRAFESLPQPKTDEFQTPVLIAGLFDWAIVWDHAEHSVRLCVIRFDDGPVADQRQSERIQWAIKKLNPTAARCAPKPCSTPPLYSSASDSDSFPLPDHPDVLSSFSADRYVTAVARVIEYIRAGDIFQANLAQQLTAPWAGSAAELYERVRKKNPAPFCGLLQADDFAIVSASPERFLKVSGDCIETRPIKGTRRRHRSPIADLYTSTELHASEKDRAENVMIVDLLRNDLSRVCSPGTVKVTGVCEIEIFETVQHLVSTVIGRLKPDCDVWDLCKAAIPGGSITGAPKIRAMQIIAELESTVRGAYCGNLFYYGLAGDFDSSILIRTFTLKGGRVQFPVGGGIVADSHPQDEYEETLHKAAGMLSCLKAGASSGIGTPPIP